MAIRTQLSNYLSCQGPHIEVADINNDGNKDIRFVGNNTWTRIKFGSYTANHGVLLTGDDKGNFNYTPKFMSGLHIRGNVINIKTMRSKNKDQFNVGLNNSDVLLLHVKKILT